MRPFRPAPSRSRFRPRPRRAWAPVLLFLSAMAVSAALALHDGASPGSAAPFAARRAPPTPDRESAQFAICGNSKRTTCVIDGDTFWYHGAKIRIADINTPETGEPRCADEARLGARATQRLTELLNQGAFTLTPSDRDTDRHGRLLRVVTRGGVSLGDTLQDEGLAEPWRGYRRDWCGPR